jgi:hypothetical protein
MVQSPLLEDSDDLIQDQVKPSKKSDSGSSSILALVRDSNSKSLHIEIHHRASGD